MSARASRIIRLVEKSPLPVRRTLDKLGIPSTTFYRWYDRYPFSPWLAPFEWSSVNVSA